MKLNNIIFSQNLSHDIWSCVKDFAQDQIFILTDTLSRTYCYPQLQNIPALEKAHILEIPNGDDNKTLDSAAFIWQYLGKHGGSRKSCLINLGGGMITDLGGFAASCFKRGMAFINIPTTLLSTIDAAIGGKTGVNFNGLKNEIGVINSASYVIIYPPFFSTLDKDNLLSGYAEMLKHALLSNKADWQEIISFNIEGYNNDELSQLIAKSLAVKENIVEIDPKEQGLRKALNLGHTIGHAFESYSYQKNKPLLHGHAVALGLIAELYLSHKIKNFPQEEMIETIRFIRENYAAFEIGCDDYEALYELMQHDKKNANKDNINFTLLESIGGIIPDNIVNKELIFQSLDFYRDSVGI